MSEQDKPQNLSALVREGLENGAFTAHYQPQFDPDSEDISGVEALLRWDHPEKGFCVAGQFMPAVEREEGLAQQVDAWVLDATLRQGRAWLDASFDFGFLNVNISSWLLGPDLVAMVEDAIEATGFPAVSLALECPWRLLAAHATEIAPTLRALKGLGCHIVLDGNPLDQECLNVVRETPVQWSKVCIEHIQEYAESHSIGQAKGAIKQWHRRGVEVIATAVESEMQLALAHKAGCRYAQGQRFKSAISEADLTHLLRAIVKTKQALSII